jgi:hypothetical protein
MAVGLNHYLKYYCLVLVTWSIDDKISVHEPFLELKENLRKDARVQNRFFLNYAHSAIGTNNLRFLLKKAHKKYFHGKPAG